MVEFASGVKGIAFFLEVPSEIFDLMEPFENSSGDEGGSGIEDGGSSSDSDSEMGEPSDSGVSDSGSSNDSGVSDAPNPNAQSDSDSDDYPEEEDARLRETIRTVVSEKIQQQEEVLGRNPLSRRERKEAALKIMEDLEISSENDIESLQKWAREIDSRQDLLRKVIQNYFEEIDGPDPSASSDSSE